MFKDVQSEFVQLGDGADPQTIPQHYAAYYDVAGQMFRRFGCFKGLDDLHPNFWPVVCLLADQEKRIRQLEAQLLECFAPPSVEKHEIPCSPRVDMRTREGRARKGAQPVGV